MKICRCWFSQNIDKIHSIAQEIVDDDDLRAMRDEGWFREIFQNEDNRKQNS
jgi:hypothetical protein